MCGIAGLWDAEPAELAPVVERMLAVIAHRGPGRRRHLRRGPLRARPPAPLDHRPRRPRLAADAGRPRPLRAHLQRRDLQLHRAARGAGRARRPLPDRVRLRGPPRRLRDVGQRLPAALQRHVRLRDPRPRREAPLLRPRPPRCQAARLRARRPPLRVRVRAQGARRRRRDLGRARPGRCLRVHRPRLHERRAQLLRRGRVAPPRPRARAGRRRDAADVGLVAARHDARRGTQLRRLVRRDRRAPRGCRPAAASQRRARRGPPLGRPRLERDRRRGRRARPEARDVHRRVPGGARERRAVVLAARRRPLRAHAARGRDRDRRAHRQLGPAALAPRRADRRPRRLPPAARLRPGARARDEGRPRWTGGRRALRRLPAPPHPPPPAAAHGRPAARARRVGGRAGTTRAARATPHPAHLDEGAGRRPRPGVPRPRRRVLPRGGAAAAPACGERGRADALGSQELPAGAAPGRGPDEHGRVARVADAAARLPARRARDSHPRPPPLPGPGRQAVAPHRRRPLAARGGRPAPRQARLPDPAPALARAAGAQGPGRVARPAGADRHAGVLAGATSNVRRASPRASSGRC